MRNHHVLELALTLLALGVVGCRPASRETPDAATAPAEPWYESVENTRQNPERMKAGEPDFVGQHRWSYPLSRENALEMLLRTEIFCSSAVGFGSVTPPQCYAFKAILRQPDAAAAFESLVRR